MHETARSMSKEEYYNTKKSRLVYMYLFEGLEPWKVSPLVNTETNWLLQLLPIRIENRLRKITSLMAQCHHSDKVKNKSAGTFYGSSKANNGNNFFHFTPKTLNNSLLTIRSIPYKFWQFGLKISTNGWSWNNKLFAKLCSPLVSAFYLLIMKYYIHIISQVVGH